MFVELWIGPWAFGTHLFSTYALVFGALQDLKERTVSRLPLFLLYGMGAVQGLDIERFCMWLLLMVCGAMFERLKKVPLGEGDLYVIAGLALIHSSFVVLVIVTLAVWLLLPFTIHAIHLKHKGQPYQLPFVPALFVARQVVLLISILV